MGHLSESKWENFSDKKKKHVKRVELRKLEMACDVAFNILKLARKQEI